MARTNTQQSAIAAHVARFGRSTAARRIALRWLWTVAALAATSAALQVAFALFPWTLLPLLWDVAVVAAGVYAIASMIDVLLLRRPTLVETARRMESIAGPGHHLLSLALEPPPADTGCSTSLSAEVAARAHADLHRYPRRTRIRLRTPLAFSGACVAAFVGTIALPGPDLSAYWRLLLSATASRSVRVEPGTVSIAYGSGVDLRLVPPADRLPSCGLSLEWLPSHAGQRHAVRADSRGVCALRVDSVRSSFVYRFSYAGIQLNTDTIRMVPRPSLYSLRVSLTPPAYTHSATHTLREGQGSFEAYAGTRARIRVASTHGLSRACLLAGCDTVRMDVDSGVAACELQVTAPLSYTFALVDSMGQTSNATPSYSVDLLADKPPTVHVLRPGTNKALAVEQVETLWVEGVDDLGIRALSLSWRRSGFPVDSSVSRDVTPPGAGRVARAEAVWDLKPLDLYPGDTVFYWAGARDNRPGGGQSAYSDTFWFRIPSFREIHEQVARGQSQAEENLSDVRSRQEKMRSEVSQLAKSTKAGKPLSWEQKESVREIARDVEAQRDTLQHAVDALRKTVEKLRNEGLSSESIVKKMEQISKAVEDLVRQYGDSLLFKPPQTNDDATWKDVQQALSTLEKLMPNLEQRLDEALRFLDALRKDQRLAALASRAGQQAQEQARLADSKESPGQSLARQKDLAAREDELLGEVRQEMQADSSGALSEQSLPARSSAERAAQQMRSQLSRNRMPSSTSQSQMSASMSALSEQLKSQMSSGMMRKLMRERDRLLDMAHDAISLSEWQKEIRDQAGKLPDRADDKARNTVIGPQQELVQGLGQSASQKDSLGMVPPASMAKISSAYASACQRGRDAVEALEAGSGVPQMGSSGAALSSLAQTLLDASSDMDGMMQGQSQGQGGEGGMMSGLRQLSGKQSAVNSLTSQLLQSMLSQGQKPGGSGQGDGASAEARAEAQAAQEGVAQKLRELADKYGSEAGGGMGERARELEREAQQLARMLANPTPEVRDRQDRFLMRMLQSSLSMHKQGEGKEDRTSQSAREVFSRELSQTPGTGGSAADSYYRMRQRMFEGNYPREYRAAVEAYADSLGAQFVR